MFNQPIMSHPNDHIMANTWRLIFEGQAQQRSYQAAQQQPVADSSVLEQILLEYRLIGLSLADRHPHHRYD